VGSENKAGEPVELHIVSDATGETATRVVLAVEVQFPDLQFEEIRHPRVTCAEDVQLAAQRARGRRAVVVYTLVDPAYREQMRTLCKRYRLHYCDVLGHPIEAVARVSGLPAKGEPGALPVLDTSYFKRIEAIEFAVQADDGVAPRRLREAEIVLVGVSRTSKTPLSIYLGYLGYRAANVPLVKGIDPPPALFEVERERIVGVTIRPELLAEIRERRVRDMRGTKRSYADPVEIYEELEHADAIFRRLGCPVIEVSTLAVEETAHRIIRIVELRLAESQERQRPRKRRAG
jgi:regulator of PEP synthase PpsR (kinase-PPPase family)